MEFQEICISERIVGEIVGISSVTIEEICLGIPEGILGKVSENISEKF